MSSIKFKFMPLIGLFLISGCISKIDVFKLNNKSSVATSNGTTPNASAGDASFFFLNHPNSGDITKFNKTTNQLETVTNTFPHSHYMELGSRTGRTVSSENDEFLYLSTSNEIHRMKISDSSLTRLTAEDGVTHSLDPYSDFAYQVSGDAISYYNYHSDYYINPGNSSRFISLSNFTNFTDYIYNLYPLGRKYFMIMSDTATLLNASITDPNLNLTSLPTNAGHPNNFYGNLAISSDSVLFLLEDAVTNQYGLFHLNYSSGAITSIRNWSSSLPLAYTTKGGDYILIDLDPTAGTGGGTIYKVDQLTGSKNFITTHQVPEEMQGSLFACLGSSSKVDASDTKIYMICGLGDDRMDLYDIDISGSGSFSSYTIATAANVSNANDLHYYQNQLYFNKIHNDGTFSLEKLTIGAGSATVGTATLIMTEFMQAICNDLSNPAGCMQDLSLMGGGSLRDYSDYIAGAHTFDTNLALGLHIHNATLDQSTYFHPMILITPSGIKYINDISNLDYFLNFIDVYGPTATGTFIFRN